MPIPLLTTKMFFPRTGPNQVERPRLLDQLEAGLRPGSLLTLVSAPAGYGKTTLVSHWIASRPAGGLFAWYSLDPADNDPALFLAYLLAALQKALPGLEADIQGLLDSPQSIIPQPVLAGLINDLADRPGPLTLVLDDYQFITAPVIHEAVAFLLDHLPPSLHLLVITRSDPPIPLHRYRARGQMVEVRADDLRFSSDEIVRFLAASAGVQLGGEELAILAERTEGWIAGLKMAALSLEKQADVSRFVRSLSGSNRYILDYLAEEVLNNQPAWLQQFLLKTSILERLCAPLCDAILKDDPAFPEFSMKRGEGLGMKDEAQSSSFILHPSSLILEGLERSNLFLIPLDDEHRWYRYHPLFRDLLRVRLKQPGTGLEPGQVKELHRRAADWFEAEGWLDEAIRHAGQAGEFDRAARLVERNTITMLARGELRTVLGWIEQLPEATVLRRPWLSIHQAWTLGFAGKLAEAVRLLDQAEQQVGDIEVVPPGDRPRMEYEIQAIRAMLATMAGKQDETLALESWMRVEMPADGLFARAAFCWAFGYTYRMGGQLDQAVAAFEEMQQLGRQMDNLWTFVSASVDLGAVLRMRGQLDRAIQVYTEALDRASRRGVYFPGFVGRLESFLASIFYEQNDLALARKHILASAEHNRWWQNLNHDLHTILVRSRIDQAEGNLAAVGEALQQADQILGQGVVVPTLRSQVQAAWVRFWLAQGQTEEALRWARNQPRSEGGSGQPDSTAEPWAIEQVARARVWMAAAEPEQAWPYLESVEERARQGGWVTAQIEALALMSLAARDQDQAMKLLAEALKLGQPGGFLRVFLDEGEKMRLLIADCRFLIEEPALRQYTEELLSAFQASRVQAESSSPISNQKSKISNLKSQTSNQQSAISNLVAPLTDREVEVLRCLAEGLTNPQIGARLYISIGTVKAHTASIFRKMDVANRTEAVARAQKWGLI